MNNTWVEKKSSDNNKEWKNKKHHSKKNT